MNRPTPPAYAGALTCPQVIPVFHGNLALSRWDTEIRHPLCGRCREETVFDGENFACRRCHLYFDPDTMKCTAYCDAPGDGLDHSSCAGSGRDLCWWCGINDAARKHCTFCGGSGLAPDDEDGGEQ
ncbi:hypothetical protein [Arsenicicoccus dermatophilus]|uniref:hypothetical protein n=1 Tax=Arsenicicoccus dermatophilus TaxID=1076331 RepID=UPI001F4C94D1|nr:hypothetical protein [Arsenicicoccus dermatophilus]